MEHIDYKQVMGSSKSGENILGKFLYFSLLNILVEKERLSELCESMGIPYSGGARMSVSDAFRSATGDIKERIVAKEYGETRIFQIYCRDNERADGMLSRELVKETVGRQTNTYEKLANIQYDKEDMLFGFDNLIYDAHVDVGAFCRKAEELFELYQRCANRKQLETICVNFLRSMKATKINGNGHLYFVPRQFMAKVDIFEDFIEMVSRVNRNETSLMCNSFYIIDDEKQRQKTTEEFYSAMKKEITEYQERASFFIDTGSQSPSIMECWVLKIQALESKKKHYEEELKRELNGLDEEYETLRFLSQELSLRSQRIRFYKAA